MLCRIIGDEHIPGHGSILWAINTDDVNVCIHIDGFAYKAYLSLPSFIRGKMIDWTNERNVNVRNLLNDVEDCGAVCRIVSKKKLWKYSHIPEYFLEVEGDTKEDLDSKAKAIDKKLLDLVGITWYERGIKSTLKFMISKDITPSSIIELNIDPDNLDMCVDYNEFLIPYDNTATSDPIENPASTKAYMHGKTLHLLVHHSDISLSHREVDIYPRMLFFDIETWSSTGKFPNAGDSRDLCYLVSLVTTKYRSSEPPLKDIVAIGGNVLPRGLDRTNRYHFVKNERELYEKMFEIIELRDPAVLASYNGHGFDIPYMERRMAGLGLCIPESMSKMPGKSPEFSILYGKRGRVMSNMQIPGMLILDVYIWVVANTQFGKLPSYKLKDVLERYVPDNMQKISLTPAEQFRIFEDFIEGVNIDRYANLLEYCLRDSESLTYLVAARDIWESLVDMSNIQFTSIQNVASSGAVHKTEPMIIKACITNNIIYEHNPEPMTVDYGGGYNMLYKPGYYDCVTVGDFEGLYPACMRWKNLSPETRISLEDYINVPAEHMQGIPIEYDLILGDDDIKVRDIDLDVDEAMDNNGSENEDDGVVNESKAALNKRRREALSGKVTKEHKKLTVYYLKPEIQEGIIPKLLRTLSEHRSVVKKEMGGKSKELEALAKSINLKYELDIADADVMDYIKKEPWAELRNKNVSDTEIAALATLSRKIKDLDIKQNSIKIVNNSVYGIMGSMAKYADPYIAIATCATGQMAIKSVERVLTTKYIGSTVIYIDTDSIFIQIPDAKVIPVKYLDYKFEHSTHDPDEIYGKERNIIEDEWAKETHDICKKFIGGMIKLFGTEVCNTANNAGIYEKPMYFAYESFGSMLSLSKKMYGLLCLPSKEIKDRGIPLRRSDYALCIRRGYGEFIHGLLYGKTLKQCMIESIEHILRMFDKSLDPISEFGTVVDFASATSYKSASVPMAKLAATAAKMGLPLEEYSKNTIVKVTDEPHIATVDMYNADDHYNIDRYAYYKMYASRCDKTCNPLLNTDRAYFVTDEDSPYIFEMDKCRDHNKYCYLTDRDEELCKICAKEDGLHPHYIPGIVWDYSNPYMSMYKLMDVYSVKACIRIFKKIYHLNDQE